MFEAQPLTIHKGRLAGKVQPFRTSVGGADLGFHRFR